jgi:hypothetical protein
MNIKGYDEWRLRGPDEVVDPLMEDCEDCKSTGKMQDKDGEFPCTECDGSGEVEATLDEPDGDYLYELRRDEALDNSKGT